MQLVETGIFVHVSDKYLYDRPKPERMAEDKATQPISLTLNHMFIVIMIGLGLAFLAWLLELLRDKYCYKIIDYVVRKFLINLML